MVTGFNNDIRSNKGCTIYMPAWYKGELGWTNLAIPNIYSANGDATALYPRGTKFVEGDRAFRYGCYLGTGAGWNTSTITATDGDDLFGKFLFNGAYQQDMADGLLVRHIAGESSMWYQTTVAAERSDNYFSGGYVNGKDTAPADARHFSRRIVAHNYTAAGTEAMFSGGSSYTYVSELQLDRPIVNSKTSMATTIMANPWKRIVWMPDTAYDSHGSAMGACMVNDVVATYNCWFQVTGPMACHHISNANEGANAFENIFYILGDGSVQAIDGSTDTYALGEGQYQMAGRLWSNSSIESGTAVDESLPMIWVELE